MSADVRESLRAARERVERAALDAGRDAAEVALLLAIKTVPATRVREVIAAGGTLLGQNRAQELVATEPELADLPHTTHFIGQLQSNKVNQVLRWVSCVQSVDTARLARRLDAALARRAEQEGQVEPLDVLLQVNTSGEETKSGVEPGGAGELAAEIASLEHLRLRGFMTIGANSADTGVVRGSYDRLAEVRETVLSSSAAGTAGAHELSMGMSADLEIAVAAGATIVRLGSAVFGARPA